MEELCARKWDKIRGDKKSVEVKEGTPNKPGYKQRMGKSPDLGDWAAGIVEMARRKGFQISKLPVEESKHKKRGVDWLSRESKKITENLLAKQLQSV